MKNYKFKINEEDMIVCDEVGYGDELVESIILNALKKSKNLKEFNDFISRWDLSVVEYKEVRQGEVDLYYWEEGNEDSCNSTKIEKTDLMEFVDNMIAEKRYSKCHMENADNCINVIFNK